MNVLMGHQSSHVTGLVKWGVNSGHMSPESRLPGVLKIFGDFLAGQPVGLGVQKYRAHYLLQTLNYLES